MDFDRDLVWDGLAMRVEPNMRMALIKILIWGRVISTDIAEYLDHRKSNSCTKTMQNILMFDWRKNCVMHTKSFQAFHLKYQRNIVGRVHLTIWKAERRIKVSKNCFFVCAEREAQLYISKAAKTFSASSLNSPIQSARGKWLTKRIICVSGAKWPSSWKFTAALQVIKVKSQPHIRFLCVQAVMWIRRSLAKWNCFLGENNDAPLWNIHARECSCFHSATQDFFCSTGIKLLGESSFGTISN